MHGGAPRDQQENTKGIAKEPETEKAGTNWRKTYTIQELEVDSFYQGQREAPNVAQCRRQSGASKD